MKNNNNKVMTYKLKQCYSNSYTVDQYICTEFRCFNASGLTLISKEDILSIYLRPQTTPLTSTCIMLESSHASTIWWTPPPPPLPPPQSYLLKLFLMNIRTLLMKLPRLFSSSELFFQTKSDQLNALSWSRYRKRNSQLICETAILKSTNEVHVDSLLYSIEKWIFIQIPSKRGSHKL